MCWQVVAGVELLVRHCAADLVRADDFDVRHRVNEERKVAEGQRAREQVAATEPSYATHVSGEASIMGRDATGRWAQLVDTEGINRRLEGAVASAVGDCCCETSCETDA